MYMEVLYKLFYRKRFWTASHYVGLNFQREKILFKFLCMKERLALHVKKSIEALTSLYHTLLSNCRSEATAGHKTATKAADSPS